MPPKKYQLTVANAQEGQRLDDVLCQWLAGVLPQPFSKAKARKLIVAGAVYLNRKRVRIASKPLRANARLEAYVDLEKLDPRSPAAVRVERSFRLGPEHVVFEDEHLIVVHKPPGLPTQPTVDEARANLFAATRAFLAERAGKSAAEVYLGLHHRLDRDTSGLLLFTKSREANASIAAQFSEHRIQKTYLALARGQAPADAWTVRDHLGQVGRGRPARWGAVKSGGSPAHTDFSVIDRAGGILRVEARPKTGRTHQIRVHLAEGGLPILGDDLYGKPGGPDRSGPSPAVPRMMLHATRLTLEHPITGERLDLAAPPPEDFETAWKAAQTPGK